MKQMKQIYLLFVPLICFFASCTRWQEAEAVIVMARYGHNPPDIVLYQYSMYTTF